MKRDDNAAVAPLRCIGARLRALAVPALAGRARLTHAAFGLIAAFKILRALVIVRRVATQLRGRLGVGELTGEVQAPLGARAKIPSVDHGLVRGIADLDEQAVAQLPCGGAG